MHAWCCCCWCLRSCWCRCCCLRCCCCCSTPADPRPLPPPTPTPPTGSAPSPTAAPRSPQSRWRRAGSTCRRARSRRTCRRGSPASLWPCRVTMAPAACAGPRAAASCLRPGRRGSQLRFRSRPFFMARRRAGTAPPCEGTRRGAALPFLRASHARASWRRATTEQRGGGGGAAGDGGQVGRLLDKPCIQLSFLLLAACRRGA